MHIFVADEHLLMVLANTNGHALQIPRCAGFYDAARAWRQKKGSGERQQMAAVLRFLNSAHYQRQGIVALPCAAHTRSLSLTGLQAAATARATWSVSDVRVAGAARRTRRRCATGVLQLLRRQAAPHLPRKARNSRDQLTSRPVIPDGSAAFQVFGRQFDGGRKAM
jgi:hypothetical protein